MVVGLIAGRHQLPVEDYIFENIENVLDFDFIREGISKFLEEKVGVVHSYGQAVNQADYTTDVELYKGSDELIVYVTGLTAVTAELIRQCAMNGVSLCLMHFDRESNSYVAQQLF